MTRALDEVAGYPVPGLNQPIPGVYWRWDVFDPEKGWRAGQRLFSTVNEAIAWKESREDLRNDRRLTLVCVMDKPRRETA